MPSIDLRNALNAVSDVVNNRPLPIREFDQIYMKTADMLLQTEHVGRVFDDRDAVFIGDGDAIALCTVHLHKQGRLPTGPRHVHILDFDERVVRSIEKFAREFGISDRVTAELYNVCDPIPEPHWQSHNAFYTNPPYGSTNDGRSVEAFLQRALESVGAQSVGCIVLADAEQYPWTAEVLRLAQRYMLTNGFIFSEIIPGFHGYHLDDAPDMTSCSMVARRLEFKACSYSSASLGRAYLDNFYGEGSPLDVQYVRDRTNGGKLPSRDHELEPLRARR